MKYTKKSIEIVNNTWEYLENNYKGSEITLNLLIDNILKQCDSNNCEKQSLLYLWDNYEFYNIDEYNYYKNYYKENFNIKVI